MRNSTARKERKRMSKETTYIVRTTSGSIFESKKVDEAPTYISLTIGEDRIHIPMTSVEFIRVTERP